MSTSDAPGDDSYQLARLGQNVEPDEVWMPNRVSDALLDLVSQLRRSYRGTFVFNQLGDHILYADAFTRLAEPYLPPVLRRDARALRKIIDDELRNTLAVCILSVDDVIGPPTDEDQPAREVTPEQSDHMWTSYYSTHFTDILCDTEFWPIVQALRDDIGLDAPPIA